LQGEGGSGAEGVEQLDTTVGDSAVGLSKDGEDDPDLPAGDAWASVTDRRVRRSADEPDELEIIHPGQLSVFDLPGNG
jgi:hypothetical protein